MIFWAPWWRFEMPTDGTSNHKFKIKKNSFHFISFHFIHMSAKKKLNIGLIGYGFMGRTHSNAYRKVNNFFDLEYRPVLKAVCARDKEKASAFASQWGYESVETDWRKLLDR